MMAYLLLILVVVVGALVAFLIKTGSNQAIRFLLTFSGAYLLSLGVFHLLPEIYEDHNHSIGLYIMLGFFIQLFLEFFSKGIEHGHNHAAQFKSQHLPMGVLAALYIHALLESMPISAHTNDFGENALLWGIVIHKLPVSIIYVSMLLQLNLSKIKLSLGIVLFALVAPIGVLIGDVFPVIQEHYKEITAIVFGIFLHISTTILFESTASHKFNFQKLAITLLGVTIAWFSA